MSDVDDVIARLQQATEQAHVVQIDLAKRQADLLEMEQSVNRLALGTPSGLVVVDRAEDLRRRLIVHRAEQLTDIHLALTQAENILRRRSGVDAAAQDSPPSQVRLLDLAIEETRRAMIEIHWIDRALTPLCQSLPSDPDLGSTARQSIDESANRLEHARRSVFRIIEELPFVAVIARDALASDADGTLREHLVTPPDPTPHRSSATSHERQRPISIFGSPDAGLGPDR